MLFCREHHIAFFGAHSDARAHGQSDFHGRVTERQTVQNGHAGQSFTQECQNIRKEKIVFARMSGIGVTEITEQNRFLLPRTPAISNCAI